MIACNQSPGVYHKFDETILRTKFRLGLSNVHIKQDLLTKSNDLTTLDSVLNHASRMEATSRELKEQISKMISEVNVYDSLSDGEDNEVGRILIYKKSKRGFSNRESKYRKTCNGCGSTQHTSEERPLKCPAYKKFAITAKRKAILEKFVVHNRRAVTLLVLP